MTTDTSGYDHSAVFPPGSFSHPAPWYELLLAQLFGTPFVSFDGPVGIAGYRWRGRIYITSHVDLTH